MGVTTFLAKVLTNYEDPGSIAVRLRKGRIAPLLDMIRTAHAKFGRADILDIGGTRAYWGIVPESVFSDHAVTVTLVNLPGWPQPPDDRHFRAVVGDGCDLSRYPDNSFHIVHSNSVIEHVGDWPRMVAFAREVRRLAPDYFVQTPNFWFPIEPHFMAPVFHWLPEPVRVALTLRFHLGHFERAPSVDAAVRNVESVRLLDVRMLSDLFPDSQVTAEKVLFFSKSLVATRRSA